MLFSAFVFQQCSLPEPTDFLPPGVAIIYPSANKVLYGTVKVLVEATDDDRVDGIKLFLDDIPVQVATGKSVEFDLNVSGFADDQLHVLMAVAEDKSGNQGYSAQIPVFISDSPDVTPPTVSIVNPQNGQQVQDTVKVVASARDDYSIKEVAFFVNGDSIATVNSYPYEYEWITRNLADSTAHTIFAKAFDNGGNWSLSNSVTVTVFPRIDREPPTIVLLYPIPGSTIPDTVNVAVDAIDKTGVAKMDFYVDGILEATDTSEPWGFTWDNSMLSPGSHTLYIKAYDLVNNVAFFGPVNFNIN